MWTPYLIDPVNLNKHEVIDTTSGQDRARTGAGATGMAFEPNKTFYAYAAFAAPPSGVDAMTVMIVDGAPMATGVPIE